MGFLNVLGNIAYHALGQSNTDAVIDIMEQGKIPKILLLPEDHTWTNETYDNLLKESEKDGIGIMYGFYDSLLSNMRAYGIKYAPYSNPGYTINHSKDYITGYFNKEKDMIFVLINRLIFERYENYFARNSNLEKFVRRYPSGFVRINEAIKYVNKKNHDRFSSIENFLSHIQDSGRKITKEHAEELITNINTVLLVNDNYLDDDKDRDLKYWGDKLLNLVDYCTEK